MAWPPDHWQQDPLGEAPQGDPLAPEAPAPAADWPPPHWLGQGDAPPFEPEPVAPEATMAPDLEQQWPPAHWVAEPDAPEPQVDAVAGGELPPAAIEQPAPAPAPEIDPVAAEAQRLADMDPEEYAAATAKRAADMEQTAAQMRLDAIGANTAQARENEQIIRTASENTRREIQDIAAEAKRVGQQKIDTGRWWNDRSTGQKIAGYLTAIMGGLLAPHQGGRNSGLELIMGEINKDIEAQKFDIQTQFDALDKRRGLVGELYQTHQDEYKAAEAARMTALESVDAELAAQMAQLDPRGTAAQRIAEARRGVRSEIAAAQSALEEQTHKRNLDLAKFDLDVAKQREVERANRMDEANARRNTAIAAENARLGRDKFEFERAQGDPAAQAVGIGRVLRNPDGTPFSTGDQTVDREILQERGKIWETDEALSAMEQMLSRIPTSQRQINIVDFFDNDEQARLKQLAADVRLRLGGVHGITPGRETAKLLDSLAGGDLSQWTPSDPVKAVKTARESIYRPHQAKLRAFGYEGEVDRPIGRVRDDMSDEARTRAEATTPLEEAESIASDPSRTPEERALARRTADWLRTTDTVSTGRGGARQLSPEEQAAHVRRRARAEPPITPGGRTF